MISNKIKQKLDVVSINDIDALSDLLEQIRKDKIQSKHKLITFCEEYLQTLVVNYSTKYYKSVKLSLSYLVEYFDNEINIDSVSIKDAENLIGWLQKKAPKGYRVYYRNIKAAFNKAVHWGYIKDNPFAKVKLRKTQQEYPTFIPKKELSSIIDGTHNDVLKEIIFFAFNTGCRLSEIAHLRWENIYLNKKFIIIGDNEFLTKTKSQRKVPISTELYDRLDKWSYRWKKANKIPTGYVFANSNGYYYNPDYISRTFKKVCRSLGMDERIHFHSLRHSFASALVQQGVSLYSVKELLGHSSITTTEIYSHLNMDSLHKAVEVLNAA